jgi:hypothetical protein
MGKKCTGTGSNNKSTSQGRNAGGATYKTSYSGGTAGGSSHTQQKCRHCKSFQLHKLMEICPAKAFSSLKCMVTNKAQHMASHAIGPWELQPPPNGETFLAALEVVEEEWVNHAVDDGKEDG